VVETEPGKHAVVVGAGIAGLTAAHRLQQLGWTVEVFESEACAGGRVETLCKQGYRIDTGATALAARYPIATQLANELDLEILWTAPYLGVYRDGRIHLLQLDRILRSGLSTKLLGWRTKIRLAKVVADILLASARGMLSYDDLRAAAPLDTETSSAYLRRVAGAEADVYFGEPITRALLLANSDQVSRVELMSGLINAVAGRLSTVRGGQGAIIAKLLGRVKHVNLCTPVTSVELSDDGVTVTYRDPQGRTRGVTADACVVATQLPVAAQICAAAYPKLARLNGALQFTQAINVAVGTTRPADTPAFLVQLPSVEDREICMIIVENNKAPDRAPAGKGLISVSWEMSASADWIDRCDDEIVERALQTVYRLFPELRGTVDFTYVKRWRIALPHTKVGVYQQIAEFAGGLDETSRLQFAGDYLSQTGQNTAVAWANRSAANIERHHGLTSTCGPASHSR
jgi:protoporphyrinogen/coproporphyrinogen III oxidase